MLGFLMSSKFLTTLCFVVIGCLVGFLIYGKIAHDHNHNDTEKSTPLFVAEAITAYAAQGKDVFDEFGDKENETWVKDDGQTYLFVINSMSGRLAVSGGGLTNPTPAQQALINYIIAMAKERPEGRWISYAWFNPTTGMEEIKRSWIVMHDDYVFGSGQFVKSGRERHGHFNKHNHPGR